MNTQPSGMYRFCPSCEVEKPLSLEVCDLCGTPLITLVDATAKDVPTPTNQSLLVPRKTAFRASSSSSQGLITLGKDVATGQPVTVAQSARYGGAYVIGKTGVGKSVLLMRLIKQDIEQGLGVCVIEPHADLINDIIASLPPERVVNDVILLDLSSSDFPFSLPLFQGVDTEDDTKVSISLNLTMELFSKLFTESGDIAKEAITMAETIASVAILLLYNPEYALADVPLLFENKAACLKLAANIPDKHADTRRWWEKLHTMKEQDKQFLIGSFERRLRLFLTDPRARRIFGQSTTKLNFREIIDSQKILLVKLDRRAPQLTSFVGAVIVHQLAFAAFSRSDIPQELRVQFNLYCDEYQRFATPTFAELLTEVRKFKIATTIAHQARGQLDHANKVATLNAAILVVFPISGQDAEELVKEFPLELAKSKYYPGSETVWVLAQKPITTLISSVGIYEDDNPVNQFIQRLLSKLRPPPHIVNIGRLKPVYHNEAEREKAEYAYRHMTHFIMNLDGLFYEVMVEKKPKVMPLNLLRDFLSNPEGGLMPEGSALGSILQAMNPSLISLPLLFQYVLPMLERNPTINTQDYAAYEQQIQHEIEVARKAYELLYTSQEPESAFNALSQAVYRVYVTYSYIPTLKTVEEKGRLAIQAQEQRVQTLLKKSHRQWREEFADWKLVDRSSFFRYRWVKEKVYPSRKEIEAKKKHAIEDAREAVVAAQKQAEEAKVAWEQGKEELTNTLTNELALLADTVFELRAVMEILARDPVKYLEGSDKKRSFPYSKFNNYLPDRSQADWRMELASDLANPSRPFTCHVKIANSYLLDTYQAIPVASLQRKQRVEQTERSIRIANFKAGYTRDKREVDAEIAARQARLLNRQPPDKPKTNQGDDE